MALFGYKPLKGKVAIVTGGTQGIGLGIADKLAALGAKVVVCARQPAKTKHIFINADVSQMIDAIHVVNETIKKFKRVDILVNNAGIFPSVPFADMTSEQWDQVMNVNLKGVFNFTKAVLPQMQKQNSGKIVNIASIAAFVGFQGLTHYCTTKAGITGFTRALALEVAPNNIRVNAIAPGMIETPGVMSTINADALKGFAQQVPLKRAGQPKDIANAVAYLASDESDYVTGQTIIVDGGYVLN